MFYDLDFQTLLNESINLDALLKLQNHTLAFEITILKYKSIYIILNLSNSFQLLTKRLICIVF